MKPQPKLKIKELKDRAGLHAIGRLRVQVWRHQGADFSENTLTQDGAEWLDEIDFYPETKHIVATLNDQIVAAARLSFHHQLNDIPHNEQLLPLASQLKGKTIAVLGRLVVDPAFQGQHLGSLLCIYRFKLAKLLGSDYVLGFATGHARMLWFAKHGFAMVGKFRSKNGLLLNDDFLYTMLIPTHELFKQHETFCNLEEPWPNIVTEATLPEIKQA